MAWDYRRYGSASDPVHKSHLNDLTGDYGCPTRFRYQMDARAAGLTYDLDRAVRADAACGTAAHETIARALTHATLGPRILAGAGAVSREHVRRVFLDELEREVSGRRVEWYEKDRDTTIDDRVAMIAGLLDDVHGYVAEVVLVEPAFVVRLGTHWLSGHIDLLYRPRRNPDALAIADWKTGATRPSPLILDHGWEAGVYSTAVYGGLFLDRAELHVERDPVTHVWCVRYGAVEVAHPSRYVAERECAERALVLAASALDAGAHPSSKLQHLGQFPSEIYHVHLGDYVPYKRGGDKQLKRAEDLAWYRRTQPCKIKYKVGDYRGPAWLPVRIGPADMARVQYRLRNVVGMIRMGRFIDQIGDQCTRCPYAGDCLTGGYAVRGDDRVELERAMQSVDTSAADELVID